MDITGVMPLPPQKLMIGRSSGRTTEGTRGPGDLEDVALGDVVVEPVGDDAARHPLDRDGQVVVGLGGTRHGVAAGVLDLSDVDPERAELTRPVPERVPEVVRHVQNERAGVLGLLHQPLHPQVMEAVAAQNVDSAGHAERPGHGRTESALTGDIVAPEMRI